MKNLNLSSRVEILQRNLQFSRDEISTWYTRYTDFHKMTITVMKTSFQKLKPKLVYYRDYSMFSNNKFCPDYQWTTLVTQATVWKIFSLVF